VEEEEPEEEEEEEELEPSLVLPVFVFEFVFALVLVLGVVDPPVVPPFCGAFASVLPPLAGFAGVSGVVGGFTGVTTAPPEFDDGVALLGVGATGGTTDEGPTEAGGCALPFPFPFPFAFVDGAAAGGDGCDAGGSELVPPLVVLPPEEGAEAALPPLPVPAALPLAAPAAADDPVVVEVVF
ncbi:hypothetical protein HK102_007880, partial [Quaeritorhiza haematococci]